MKNIIKAIVLIGLIGIINEGAFAQKSGEMVSPAVNSAFMAKFPQVRMKKWKMRGDTCIASFKLYKRHYMAYFSNDGSWIRTDRNLVHFANLPMSTQTYLKTSKYASWHFDGFIKRQTPTQTMYVVRIDNHSGSPVEYEDAGDADNNSLYFNSAGTLVKANAN